MTDLTKPASLPDPLATWRELLTQGETRSNALLNRMMGTEGFAALLGRSNGMALGMKRMLDQMMLKYLDAMHMPSREEVSALGERLSAVEAQLIRLADGIARVVPVNGPGVERPPKTRKPSPPREAPPPAAAVASPPPVVRNKGAPARRKAAVGGTR